MDIDVLIKQVIPIYDLIRRNPRTNRPDCNMTKDYKLLKRAAMKKEIEAVITRYKNETKEL